MIKHLRGELLHRETVILENIENLKVKQSTIYQIYIIVKFQETNNMIDKMKECAAKYYKQQQDIIEEKDREITLLIENKNKEVSNVIQERKRSLDEKNKEVSKIYQDKQKEASKMLQALNITKDELDNANRIISEMEKKNQALEENLRDMDKSIRDKSNEIKKLQNEKKDAFDAHVCKINQMRQHQELASIEKDKELKRINIGNQKEVSKLTDALMVAHDELSALKEDIIRFKETKTKLEDDFALKEQEAITLRKSVDETKKKNEFKSNLERSFESLQKQFQMKVDELERVKKYLEKDERKKLPSCNKL